MLPYKAGTVTITQGGPNVVGAETLVLTNVRVGDLFTIDDTNWYPVAQVVDDLNLLLDINYPGETVTAQTYSISRISSNWGMNSNIECELVELIDDFQRRLDEEWKGIKGDTGNVAFRVCGHYAATRTYAPGDIVFAADAGWMCILTSTGNSPETVPSAFWAELTITQNLSTEGDPT